MDFEDTPEAAQFRAEALAWLQANASLKKATGNWSELHLSTEPGVREDYERRTAEWQRTLFDGGWAGITWPIESPILSEKDRCAPQLKDVEEQLIDYEP